MEYYKSQYTDEMVAIHESPNSIGENLAIFASTTADGWFWAVPEFYSTVRSTWVESTLEQFLKYKKQGI